MNDNNNQALEEYAKDEQPDTLQIQDTGEIKLFPQLLSAKELNSLEVAPKRYLLEPLLPVVGTALLAGQPDTGKSQFTRQLAIEVSQGRDTFLGFPLNLVHKRALYVVTEDDHVNVKYLSQMQHAGLGVTPSDNLLYFFPASTKQSVLVANLEGLLKEESVDLVIVDSFGDIFEGHDMNSTTLMRQTINAFHSLALRYQCLVLFVHHINKGAYALRPGQQHIQGGGGLTQKVRLAWQLTPGSGSERFLTVVKGNYTPQEHKDNSLILHFDPDTFTFTKAGTVKTSQINSPEIAGFNADVSKALPLIKEKLNSRDGFTHTELWQAIKDLTGRSEATAKRDINDLLEAGKVKRHLDGRKYVWSILKSTDTSCDEFVQEDELDEEDYGSCSEAA